MAVVVHSHWCKHRFYPLLDAHHSSLHILNLYLFLLYYAMHGFRVASIHTILNHPRSTYPCCWPIGLHHRVGSRVDVLHCPWVSFAPNQRRLSFLCRQAMLALHASANAWKALSWYSHRQVLMIEGMIGIAVVPSRSWHMPGLSRARVADANSKKIGWFMVCFLDFNIAVWTH